MLRCFSISFVHKLYRQEIIKRACFKRGWAPNPAVKCPPALLHQPEPNSRYMLQRNRKWYKTVLHNVLSDGSLCKWLESSIKSQINVIIKHQHINLDVSRALFHKSCYTVKSKAGPRKANVSRLKAPATKLTGHFLSMFTFGIDKPFFSSFLFLTTQGEKTITKTKKKKFVHMIAETL